jgi:hypothetical protein
MLACLLATAMIGNATVWRRALAFNFFTRYARKSVKMVLLFSSYSARVIMSLILTIFKL